MERKIKLGDLLKLYVGEDYDILQKNLSGCYNLVREENHKDTAVKEIEISQGRLFILIEND